MYDAASTSPSPPISSLVRAIFETEFIHSLKRPPVLLVGGLEAWKREVGDQDVVRGTVIGSDASVVSVVKENFPEVTVRTSPIIPELPSANAQPADHHAKWVPGSRPSAGPQDSVVSGLRERSRTYYAAQTPARSVVLVYGPVERGLIYF
jgi:ubiquitin carboxyl-terminal hydrolase 8